MSKKRKKRTRPAKADRPPETSPEQDTRNPGLTWPADFASPRTAALIALSLALLAALLFGLAITDGLIWAKMTIGWLLGFADPAFLAHRPGEPPMSWDLAGVLWGLAAVTGAGIVHPSLGLVVLTLFRPWLDGYTYPTDNIYFLWGILILFALWGARLVFRGGTIRCRIPTLLLLAYMAVGILTSLSAIQFDRTYTQILLWASYTALFVVTANSIRDRATFGVLLTGLVVSMAAQTLFSILHFEFLLPYLRKLVQDPRVLKAYFDTEVMTPELARRFQVNRAFGSMLYPNALAGFLILGLPLSALGAVVSWRTFLPAWRAIRGEPIDAKIRERRRYAAASAGLGAWFVTALSLYLALQFYVAYHEGNLPWYMADYPLAALASAIALAPAAALLFFTDRFGIVLSGHLVRTAGFALLTPLQCWALWITYSRGGMLALTVAALATAGLLILARRQAPGRRKMPRQAAAAALLLAACLLTAAAKPHNSPAPNPPTQPRAQRQAPAQAPTTPAAKQTMVTQEGIDVHASDLFNPATFGLRLTYWTVGLAMFRHNPWTGVGLGNFAVAYPRYQYLGAAPVQEAHNCYLQAFCETGLFGGLLFLLFWAYLLIWGACRILREHDRNERWILAGLYAGILAFLMHAFIDIHFAHPSLAMFIMIFAGLFCARARLQAKAQTATLNPRTQVPHQLAALALLAAAALAAGMSVRLYLQDLAISRVSFVNVSEDKYLDFRYKAAEFFFWDIFRWAQSESRSAKKPRIAVEAARTVLPNLDLYPDIGTIYAPVPDTPTSFQRIPPGAPIPNNAILMIEKPWKSMTEALKGVDAWMAEFEALDSRFPYKPKLAVQVGRWYFMLSQRWKGPKHAEAWRRYMARTMYWTEEAVRRSPMSADVYVLRAQALWLRGNLDNTNDRFDLFKQSLQAFRQAAACAPLSKDILFAHRDALQELAKACESAGKTQEAQAYTKQRDQLQAQAEQLAAELAKHGTP